MYMNNSLNEEEISETYQIRNFNRKDAKDVANIIKDSLLKINKDTCLFERIKSFVNDCNADKILEINLYSRIYVMCVHKRIVACGIISKNLEDDSIHLTVFVEPHLQGKGISKKIIVQLEKDEYYVNARKIQIASSIAAMKFYNKMESSINKELDHVSA